MKREKNKTFCPYCHISLRTLGISIFACFIYHMNKQTNNASNKQTNKPMNMGPHTKPYLLIDWGVNIIFCTALYIYCSVQYCMCTVLYMYCTVCVLYYMCTVLYCTVLHYNLVYYAVLCCGILQYYIKFLYCTVLNCTAY